MPPRSLSPASLPSPLLATLSSITAYLGYLALKFLASPAPNSSYLLSLPYSHFVELARWSLQISPHPRALNFTEVKFSVGPHLACVGFFRLIFPGGLSSTSSHPGDTAGGLEGARTWFGRLAQAQPRWARKLGGLPALVLREGGIGGVRIIPDSFGIMEYAGFRIGEDFRRRMDGRLGTSVRRFAYSTIFRTNMSLYRRGKQGASNAGTRSRVG